MQKIIDRLFAKPSILTFDKACCEASSGVNTRLMSSAASNTTQSKVKRRRFCKKSKPIGIFGGTFDPIHHGHLRIALELYQRFEWQAVRLIPCQIPVLAKKAYATPQQRVAMLQLAIKNQPGLIIDERELKRATPSYTIETLISLREEFPDTPFCLILGYDALLSLEQWHRWQELLEYAHFVVIPRPTYNISAKGITAELIQKHGVTDAKRLYEQQAGLIFIADLAPLAISATNIREHIAQGFSPRYLLPDAVWDYIQQEKLYK